MPTDRDAIIRSRIHDIGMECFPDNVPTQWTIRVIVHEGAYSFVEAQGEPSVGYPKLIFVLRWNGSPTVVGCYSFDKGRWRLLFTTPDTPSDWQELFRPEKFSGEEPNATLAFELEILDLLRFGRKIEAIKVYREKMGVGLKDAKEGVEALARKYGLELKGTGCAGAALVLVGIIAWWAVGG